MNVSYERWLQECKNQVLLDELMRIQGDEEAIRDRFYSELSFGTGGLRGVIGAGSNRMNIYTVGKATQGYADYLKQNNNTPSVAIAHDNRKNSDLFARHAACVLAANGIRVFFYPVLTPTPMLSFAVRFYGADGGIVITASHNPKQYNGYKVYGKDGCQITDETAHAIEACIGKVDIFNDVRISDFDALLKAGNITYIESECNEKYLDTIQSLAPGSKETAASFSLVYTPLNGTGRVPVTETLKRAGFKKVYIVKEQEMPDPDFKTCPYPNPEIKEALELGITEMKKTGADMLLATDPDCDRVGTAVWDHGEIRLMTGNEIGILLMDHICKTRKSDRTMPKNPVMVKTIVTTEQAEDIAAFYGVELRNVLTGFKYIGEQIGLLEKEGQKERYLLGFEESYGYLSGTEVRDKDGVNAALLICRMAAELKNEGKTLADTLRDIQSRFGVWEQGLESITFPGEDGMKKMKHIMQCLRENTPEMILDLKLTVKEDYLLHRKTDMVQGTSEIIDLPESNVLKLRFGDNVSLVCRPSGTEPKLKMYYSVRASCEQSARELLSAFKAAVKPLIERI